MPNRRLEIARIRCDRDVNSYVVTCSATREAVIIDPGSPGPKVLDQLKGLTVRHVLVSHGHNGHSASKQEIKDATGATVVMHKADAAMFLKSADIYAQGDEELEFGQFRVRIILTPGHSPGSLCFLIGNHLFSGDTLLAGRLGKEMPTTDLRRQIQSIVLSLLPLPSNTVLYPGHGKSSTLGAERLDNPYLRLA